MSPPTIANVPLTFFRDLFDRGLGELPMLQRTRDRVLVGNLVMDKGELRLRDRGLMHGIKPEAVAVCWDLGIVGAVCDLQGNEWSSLTYLGADHCKIPVDLSATRHRLLKGITSTVGEDAITFKGSVYRGLKLLLDAHLLPLVLPLPIDTDEDVIGLAVCDFRFASLPLEILPKVNELVRTSVDHHLTLGIEEFELSDDEFQELFAGYTKQED